MIDDIEKLNKLNYDYSSHAFNVSIIASYNNLFKNPLEIFDDGFSVIGRKKKALFVLKDHRWNEEMNIISETPIRECKKKTKEIVYDLKQIFTNPTKEVRRAMSLKNRKEIRITGIDNSLDLYKIVDEIFKDWKTAKENDPKVFRIAFSPGRYLRGFYLPRWLCNYQKIVYIKDKPYALINFSFNPNKPIAYEIGFISRFWDKDLKIINDLNFCILVNCFYDLFQNYKIEKINVGPTAGIKGLKVFKDKLPHDYQLVYSN